MKKKPIPRWLAIDTSTWPGSMHAAGREYKLPGRRGKYRTDTPDQVALIEYYQMGEHFGHDVGLMECLADAEIKVIDLQTGEATYWSVHVSEKTPRQMTEEEWVKNRKGYYKPEEYERPEYDHADYWDETVPLKFKP